jgi:hypothetical protein
MAVRLALLLLLVGTSAAMATSYAPPEKHDVRSPDGTHVLHVDPQEQRLTVASTSDPAVPLWSIPHRIQWEQYFLAPGGQRIAVVAWRFIQVERLGDPGVEILGPAGRVTAYSIESLVAQPPMIHGVGPIGPFWREWLAGASQSGARLLVETTGLHRYTFDLVSGGEPASELRLGGVGMLALAYALLLIAIGLVVWARRAGRSTEWPIERRRFVTAVVPPVATFTWLWLHLGMVPLVPAEVLSMIRLALVVGALGSVPFALLAIARIPAGRRLGRIALVLATPIVIGLVLVFL